MWLAGGYFDESFDECEDRCYTIAGYIGPQLPAVILDLRWKDLLKHYNMAYFKCSELEFGFGEFAQYRDDPSNMQAPLSAQEKAKIREIKTAFVNLICDEEHMLGISASVILRDYKLLQMQEPELAKRLPDPYTMCGQLVMVEAGTVVNWSNANSSPDNQTLLRPVFDSHEDYSFRFIKAFESFSQKNPKSAQYLLPPIYETEQTYRCIQAADCLAYEARRLVDRTVYEPNDIRDRVAMNRLAEHVRAIYVLDYYALKHIAANQSPDRIPIEPSIDNRPKYRMIGDSRT